MQDVPTLSATSSLASAETQLILWTVLEQNQSLNVSQWVTLGGQFFWKLEKAIPESFGIPFAHAIKDCSKIGNRLKSILKRTAANLESETAETDREETSMRNRSSERVTVAKCFFEFVFDFSVPKKGSR